ncbi:MAG: DUF664 domain-containing protein [Streptosporangiaceae bacterium]
MDLPGAGAPSCHRRRAVLVPQHLRRAASRAASLRCSRLASRPGRASRRHSGLVPREIELANAIIASADPDAEPARWLSQWGDWRLHNLREIMLHVITETACHAGHLDAVRELIDGRTWMVLTE